MCGIIGYVTKKPRTALTHFMGQGLIVDSLRGMCGTGIYAYNPRSSEINIYKRALTGQDFINSRQFELFRENMTNYEVVIGHNRASTIGSAKDENCHPFQYDHIGLVHNGTLQRYINLVDGFTHQVDSAYAANAFAKLGAKETLEQLEGAFVFVWHDAKNNTFNIARNSMRDIWWIADKEGDNLYFASEYMMLDWLLERNGIAVHDGYKNPSEYNIYSWDLAKPFKKPKITKFEKYVYKPAAPSQYGNWGGTENRWDQARMHRDEKDLAEYNVGLFEFLTAEPGFTFEAYSHHTTKGAINGKVKVKQKDDSIKELSFRIHGIENWEFDKVKDKTIEFTCASVWNDKDVPILTSRYMREKKKEEVDSKEVSKSKSKEVTKVDDLVFGPKGCWITRETFAELSKGGCCYCGDPIFVADHKQIGWIDWGTSTLEPLCQRCHNDPAVRAEIRHYQKEATWN